MHSVIEMKRIFINMYDNDHDWILGKIADDIVRVATELGYSCHCGKSEEYDGEEICYHLDWHLAVPIPMARHNSVFYTHLNDKLQEKTICEQKDRFDSFICMSQEDAQFLTELGFDESRVYGKTLPVRNSYVKPLSIGIFSACYFDGRKNESWLVDYCKNYDNAKLINFVFIGKGWGNVVKELEDAGCTYEWHNVSRKLPYEYQFQQNKLASLNYYIYMGMDGGAMGTYDAYAQDVPLCVTYDGFHKSIPDIDLRFDDKKSFCEQLDAIVSKHARRLDFFSQNNSTNYVKWLIGVWKGEAPSEIEEKYKECINYKTVLEKKRDQYYGLSLSRIQLYIRRKSYRTRNRKNNSSK